MSKFCRCSITSSLLQNLVICLFKIYSTFLSELPWISIMGLLCYHYYHHFLLFYKLTDSLPEGSCKWAFVKGNWKFTGKHLWCRPVWVNLTPLRSCHFPKFSSISFFENASDRLLFCFPSSERFMYRSQAYWHFLFLSSTESFLSRWRAYWQFLFSSSSERF